MCHCNCHPFDKGRLEENLSCVRTSKKWVVSSSGLPQAPYVPQAGFAFLDFCTGGLLWGGGDEPVIAAPDSQRPRGLAAKARAEIFLLGE